MAAHTASVLVLQLEKHLEDTIIDVGILESFQKIGYECPTEDRVQAVSNFVFRSDVLVLVPNESSKLLCYACLWYIFDG